MPATWQTWAILSAVFAALTAIFGKIGVENVGSDLPPSSARSSSSWRWWRSFPQPAGGRRLPPSHRAAYFLVLSGLATGASRICYCRALQAGQAAQVAPVDKLSVVLVALFGALFLGERLSPAAWEGVFLIAAGAALVAWR